MIVQSLSHVRLCDLVNCSTLGSSVLHCLPDFAHTYVFWVSNQLILCRPLSSPSIFPSIMIFSNQSVHHIRWPKYWSFSFGISPSNENVGLISFRMDWFDLTVQGSLESLLQHHNSKASVLWYSANSHISTWLLEKP